MKTHLAINITFRREEPQPSIKTVKLSLCAHKKGKASLALSMCSLRQTLWCEMLIQIVAVECVSFVHIQDGSQLSVVHLGTGSLSLPTPVTRSV